MNLWHNHRALNLIASALVAVVFIAVLASGVFWAMQRPQFTLRHVVIEPAPGYALRHAASHTLRRTAERNAGGNFFTIDLDVVRHAMQSVPWVRQASVRRVWPDTLVIGVEEHQPLGIWGESRLINTFGELFVASIGEAEQDGPLPMLGGPDGSERLVLRRYEDLRHWLADLGRKPETVTLSARHAWTVRLDDETTLVLGRDQGVPIEDRVKRWAAVFPHVQEQLDRKAEVIDLRYPSGFAIRSVKLLAAEGDSAKAPGSVSVAKLNR